MRILEGWTKEERKELEEAKDNDFFSAIPLISGIVDHDDDCISLTGKYMDETTDEDNQLARDIADFYAGAAKFPEQMYKLTLPDGNYLVKNKIDGNRWMFTYSDRDGYLIKHSIGDENTFTKEEIENIDSRFMAFAVPVEE